MTRKIRAGRKCSSPIRRRDEARRSRASDAHQPARRRRGVKVHSSSTAGTSDPALGLDRRAGAISAPSMHLPWRQVWP